MHNREQMILDRIVGNQTFSYEKLADIFGVCPMTIRRDMERLVQRGAVIKMLGGVRRAAPETANLHETALLSRLANQRLEKQAIARQALGLLQAGQTVFIDGGSTCLELVKLLAREAKGLTVMTNSIMVCRDLGQNNNNVVVGLGGQYDPASLSFMGAACEEEASKFFPDIAMFSTKGFVPAIGTYESFFPTLHIKQLIARQSRRVVLLADYTKFGQHALRKVLDISQIHDIITDTAAPRADLAMLKKQNKRVWIATADPATLGELRRARARWRTGQKGR